MSRAVRFLLLGCLLAGSWLAPADDDLVFHSDVSLVRVDAQVLDGNRAITRLKADDFILREEGRTVPIRGFASENMPVDILFLLDVSGSMRPHVERIADASGQALTVMGKDDRMAIMVFDRNTRVRLPFSSSRSEVQREFNRLLNQEQFNGGTDITRAMLDAAEYIRQGGRRDARRAIVILTDDQTQYERDDEGGRTGADAGRCGAVCIDRSCRDPQRRRLSGSRTAAGHLGRWAGDRRAVRRNHLRAAGRRRALWRRWSRRRRPHGWFTRPFRGNGADCPRFGWRQHVRQ